MDILKIIKIHQCEIYETKITDSMRFKYTQTTSDCCGDYKSNKLHSGPVLKNLQSINNQ